MRGTRTQSHPQRSIRSIHEPAFILYNRRMGIVSRTMDQLPVPGRADHFVILGMEA